MPDVKKAIVKSEGPADRRRESSWRKATELSARSLVELLHQMHLRDAVHLTDWQVLY